LTTHVYSNPSNNLVHKKKKNIYIKRKLCKEIKLPMDLDIHKDIIHVNTKVPDKRSGVLVTEHNLQDINSGEDYETRVLPFKARILELGFIRAESAVIGLLKGWFGMVISIMTTLFWGEVSRTHIYLSDSIVTCVNVMNCVLMPMLGNCNHKWDHMTQITPLNTLLAKQFISNIEQLCFTLSSSENKKQKKIEKTQICTYVTVSKLVN